MCIAPVRLANGIEVACRDCWQCRSNRVNDWVGRCIAESKSASAAHMITLTYGRGEDGAPNHPNAVYLTYSDVQKFFKQLRFDGFPLRYFAVGEYGSNKGRAHWHIIVFWKDKVPEHVLDKRTHMKQWEHGFVFWQKVGFESFKYAAKYIQKDTGAGAKQSKQAMCRMSKQPPLGMFYFEEFAARYVKARLAPQDLFYYWPEVINSVGSVVQFKMQGRVAEMFMDSYMWQWHAAYPGVHIPASELVEEYQDKRARGLREIYALEARLAASRRQPMNSRIEDLIVDKYWDNWQRWQDEAPEMSFEQWKELKWQEVADALVSAEQRPLETLSQAKLEMEELWQRGKTYYTRDRARTKR